jgi:topoisomerase-4 subunit A
MRPEDKEDDYIEDKENEEIEDINSDTQDNETTEEEANTHSDYKVPGKGDTRVTTYHLSGMYQNWFLDYASYVILERAVPHINDGLKPVQRRILHSMRRLDDGRYNKVANIVGHTMQFHPHGDASIGDALVQLGQKDLLIDCQGNGRRSRRSSLYRGSPFQVCLGDRIQSQDNPLAAFLRRA